MATILVVDDQKANRSVIVAILRPRGHTLLQADDGAAGLEIARSKPVDLVITDIVMPVMDGYELVRELRADPTLATTKVVFYTAEYLVEEVRPIAAASGVRHILPKPADPELVRRVVDDVLDERADARHDTPEQFDREHLRALSAKLVEKIRELEGAEMALRASEMRFRSLAEGSPIGIFSMDLDGSFVYANPALRQSCGLDVADTTATWADLVAPETRDDVADHIRTVVARREELRRRLRVARPDGAWRWIDVRAGPVEDGGTALTYVGTADDVTETVDAQRRQEEVEARLRTSERLESLGQLAAGVAHDFNNLLGVILNYAHFVASAAGEAAAAPNADEHLGQIRDDAEQIRVAARRAADLTEQLLIFGRREILQPEVLDPNRVVGEAGSLLSRTIGEHIDLEIRLEPDVWFVDADPSRLSQVIVNLVVNARDAISGTGSVVVTTENVTLDEDGAATEGVGRPGAYVRLAISDNGSGMPAEVQARAFEPFFTTKPKGSGTGLGLATAYGIVQQLGGSVGIDSVVGRGTTVRLLLPAVEGALRPEDPGGGQVAQGNGETVLVVEDDPAMRAVTVRILEGNGYVVMTAEDGVDALAMLGDPAVEVDMLLTDVVMPKMTGRELAARVSRMVPSFPILFMSGYADGLAAPQSVLPEGVELLDKPFTEEELLARVARILGR